MNKILWLKVVLFNLLAVWREYGFKTFIWQLFQKINIRLKSGVLFQKIKPYSIYPQWKIVEKIDLDYQPLISIIIPVYDVAVEYFKLTLNSVKKQDYKNWEIVIVNDCSSDPALLKMLSTLDSYNIKVLHNDKNAGISESLNRGIVEAKGEYVTFLDHDDELTRDCLQEFVKSINIGNKPDMVYSDEAIISADKRYVLGLQHKPDFDTHLLMNHNYITHCVVVKKSLLKKTGMFDSRYNGAQDYDLMLRIEEKADKILHIPQVLYLWKAIATSTALSSSSKPYTAIAGKKALEDALRRRKIKGNVLHVKNHPNFYRVKRDILKKDKVTIIIPFKDKADYLGKCIRSILKKTRYENYEIIAINNQSREEETFNEIIKLKNLDKRIKFLEFNEEFNYSRINNFGASKAQGSHLLFLNNDIEIISADWMESMLEYSQLPNIGAVGGQLLYPNRNLQHIGIITGILGYAGHALVGQPQSTTLAGGRAYTSRSQTAVTAAMLMVKKTVFDTVSGFDAAFKVAANDVDLCLRIFNKGYVNIYTPYSQAIHYESISRGYDDTMEKMDRFSQEMILFVKKHKNIILDGDPFYNANLTLLSNQCFVADKNEILNRKHWKNEIIGLAERDQPFWRF